MINQAKISKAAHAHPRHFLHLNGINMTEIGTLALAALREVSLGLDIIRKALKEICTGDPLNAAFPLVGREAQVYLEAKAGAYLQVLVAASPAALERTLMEAQAAPPDEGALVARLRSIGQAFDFLERALSTSGDLRLKDVQLHFPHLSAKEAARHVASVADAYCHALEMCDSGRVQALVANLEGQALPENGEMVPPRKQLRPLQPWASAEVGAAVLSRLDASSKKPMIRRDRDGAGCYVVGLDPNTGVPIAVVNGNFGRGEFHAVISEMAANKLDAPNALIAVARTSTYSGNAIHFCKFEELGVDADGLTAGHPEIPARPDSQTDGTTVRASRRYCVEAHGSQDLDVSPSVAVFEVDVELARQIVSLAQLAQSNDLARVERSDYRADFLRYDPETSPEEAADAGEENSVRTECDYLVVTHDEFFFQALVKHSDVRVETQAMSVADLAEHFRLPYGEEAQYAVLQSQVSAALPGSDGYEKGFKDALESIALVLAPKIAEPILAEAITSALDAYGNNADNDDDRRYERQSA